MARYQSGGLIWWNKLGYHHMTRFNPSIIELLEHSWGEEFFLMFRSLDDISPVLRDFKQPISNRF